MSGDTLYISLGILLFSLQQSNYQNNASDKHLSDLLYIVITFITLETTLLTLKTKATLQKKLTNLTPFLTLLNLTNETWCP